MTELDVPSSPPSQEDANRIEAASGVLYLGKLPPRAVGEYFAVIPVRPPAGSMVRACRRLVEAHAC